MYSVQELFNQYQSQKSETVSEETTLTAAAVLAHPDDEIIISNLIAEANKFGINMVGITLTRGEASTKNNRDFDPDFDLAQGSRGSEAREGALAIGFKNHHQLDGTDKNLKRDVPRQVPEVANLLVAHEVDLVFGISQMGEADSFDHEAASRVGRAAAFHAAQHLGHVGMLTIQSGARGQWLAESSTESLDIVQKIAAANDSQFRVGPASDRPDDWHQITPGHAMHPEDWAELDRLYPISGTATYSLSQYGRLLIPQLVEI